jgi:hypothetical protein
MKKIILLLSIAFVSCQKNDIPERCATCVLINGQIWSYVCEEQLDTLTIEEYVSYWDNAGNLVCQINN